MKRASLEQFTLIYALTYIPNFALTKWLATRADDGLARRDPEWHLDAHY